MDRYRHALWSALHPPHLASQGKILECTLSSKIMWREENFRWPPPHVRTEGRLKKKCLIDKWVPWYDGCQYGDSDFTHCLGSLHIIMKRFIRVMRMPIWRLCLSFFFFLQAATLLILFLLLSMALFVKARDVFVLFQFNRDPNLPFIVFFFARISCL